MSEFHEVNITFNPDGTIELDQIGWKGSTCNGAIQDLVRILGEQRKVTQKPEYFQPAQVQIQERE